MKACNLLILISVMFLSNHAFAQVPSCPCDTQELPNGTTGDDIVELLCPGGELVEDAVSTVSAGAVSIKLTDDSAIYVIFTTVDKGNFCIISNEGDTGGIFLSGQQADDCRDSLVQRCGLSTRSIPAISEWGMIAMAGVLGVIGLIAASRRRKAAA